jgi:hypothetical protein
MTVVVVLVLRTELALPPMLCLRRAAAVLLPCRCAFAVPSPCLRRLHLDHHLHRCCCCAFAVLLPCWRPFAVPASTNTFITVAVPPCLRRAVAMPSPRCHRRATTMPLPCAVPPLCQCRVGPVGFSLSTPFLVPPIFPTYLPLQHWRHSSSNRHYSCHKSDSCYSILLAASLSLGNQTMGWFVTRTD